MLVTDEAIANFGKRIQEARQLHNVTQEQLAEHCGVSPKHISALERGTSLGSIKLLLYICDYLKITPNSLLIDSIDIDNKQKDTIIPLNKHDVFLKYAKLSKNNQKYIDHSICHIYDQQVSKS